VLICLGARVFLFRAETEQLRSSFVHSILTHLQPLFTPELWQQKLDACAQLNSLLREQFILQVQRHQLLVKALAKTGFMEDELPITSTRKEKSGVLCKQHINT
jgi:hypothetical protein